MTTHIAPKSRGRAAVYCRRSHWDEGVSHSVTTQGESGRRHGELLGFTVEDEDIYVDDGISGMTNERPSFRELMLKLFHPERPYKAVIVLDISRLSRASGGYIDYEELFAEANIELISIMDPPSNPQVKINTTRRMKAVMNEAQVVDGALKTRQCQMLAVEMGFYIGWVHPFGYRKTKVIWRGAEHTKLEVDPETWPHLLHIIDMAKDNYTIPEIQKYLEHTGLKHPAGDVDNKRRGGKIGTGKWSKTNIPYLLKNLTLLGWTFRGGEGSGSKILHKSEQVICRDAHPIAMTWEDRELILRNFASRTSENKNPKVHRSPNPLASLTVCGMCGATMRMHTEVDNGKPVQRLICANRRDYKKGHPDWCPNPSVRLDVLIQRTLAKLLGHILTPSVLRQQVNMVADMNENFVANQVRRKKEIDKQTKQLQREIENIVNATAAGNRNPAYDHGIERRQNEIELLQHETEAIDADLQGKLAFVNQPERIIENALNLRTYLESNDRHSVQQMLHSLIGRASIINRVATVDYTVPLPRDKTKEPILRDLVPLGKELVHP